MSSDFESAAGANLERRLSAFASDTVFCDDIVLHRVRPARLPSSESFPDEIHPSLKMSLESEGVASLYLHQAEAIRAVFEGKDVAISTGTASGKTLCYNVPVLDRIIRDDSATALYLFPTKALTRDQIANAEALVARLETAIPIGTYDGDTPASQRQSRRNEAAIVATNHYMLHTGILPHHHKWERFFSGLAFVVIDEMHTCTGVFGSHVANILRRLKRICAHYGSSPRFILCSATLRNPGELGEALIGRPVSVVSKDGSPSGDKHFIHINPALVDQGQGLRRSVMGEVRNVVSCFSPFGVKTIVFASSRNSVELLVRYLKEDYREGGRDPERVRGYRGGYLPELRRSLERELKDGDLDVIVSTNALELGIDIGSLDLAILAGYPGSRAAFFQQGGRAGRRTDLSAMILVGRSFPLDQYVLKHPEYLYGEPQDAAAVDPDNLVIRLNQLKCSAFELPFQEGEAFGTADTDRILEYLAGEGRMLRKADGRYLWAARGFPADEVSLDSGDVDTVVIHDVGTGQTLAEIDRQSAQSMVHEGAVYQHQGETWLVRKLDWEGGIARVEKQDVDYHTEAQVDVEMSVLTLDREEKLPHSTAVLSDVTVKKTVTSFKKLRFHTRENLGVGRVHLPTEEMETDAFILNLDTEEAERVGLMNGGNVRALHGLASLLHHIAPLFVRAAASDFGRSSEVRSPRFLCPTIYLFDDHHGGVGLSEKVFESRAEILKACHSVISTCGCIDGCPSCIGPGKGGAAVKGIALELLRGICGEP